MNKIKTTNDFPKPVVLMILDGWGISPAWGGNSFSIAKTPNFNKLWRKYPHCKLEAAGKAVGLPHGDIGNSEVGHMNIGAGRIVTQDLSRINKEIANKNFFKNKVLLETIEHCKKNKSNLHLLGMVGESGVHSHTSHLFALLELCHQQNFKDVLIHIITDGRDSPLDSAMSFVQKIEHRLKTLKFGAVASVMGRYYAMDRDNRWERTIKAFHALTSSKGELAVSALNAISKSYAKGVNDEFISPTIIVKKNRSLPRVSNNDALIFFNFRADRARQLTQAFTLKKFDRFDRGRIFKNFYFASMLPYEREYKGDIHPVFEAKQLSGCLAEVLSKNHKSQFHIGETEKYAHITYFLNGAIEKPFPLEKRLLIPSPRVATYDEKPEMSASGITKKVLENISNFDFIVINFANPDMVAHTGSQEATIRALEFVDGCIGQICDAILDYGGALIITADHGNAEELINPKTGQTATEHTKNPVPFILISNLPYNFSLRHKGEFVLANIAPTILEIMKIEKPSIMTAESLIEHNETKI